MKEYKFEFEGKVVIEGQEDIIIKPFHIARMIRISNYLEKNMPMIMLNLQVDKKVFDRIIENAKTETFYLKISKYQWDDSDVTSTVRNVETYIDDEFSVIVSNDINYNKELDYPDSSSGLSESMTERKDIVRKFNIGLISKKSIEANKVVSNGIVHESSMQDLVGYYMKDLHLLMEPFVYNEQIKQLTIPPMDTLVQLINFLNSVKVFYPTKYILFIDEPYCTYLISRSGTGVKKKDESIIDVEFDVKKSTDHGVLQRGVDVNTETNQYGIVVPAVSTRYNIDHDAAKLYNNLETIINPSAETDIKSSNEIKKAADYINKMANDFRSQIDTFLKGFGDGIGSILGAETKTLLGSAKTTMPNLMDIQKQFVDTVVDEVFQVPTMETVEVDDISVDVDLISSSFKDMAKDALNGAIGGIMGQLPDITELANNFESGVNMIAGNFQATKLLDNRLGAVTFINAQDIVKQTNQSINSLTSSITSNVGKYMNQVTSQLSVITDTVSSVSDLVSGVQDVIDVLETINSNPYSQYLSKGTKEQLEKIKSNSNKMQGISQEMNTECNTITNCVNKVQGISSKLNSFSNSMGKFTSSLNNLKIMNTKNKFSTKVNDIRDTISSVSSKATSLSNLMSSVSNDGKISLSDIGNITENLNKILDIGNIGQLGLGSIMTKLNVGGTNIGKVLGNAIGIKTPGTKIIKTKNDNPNMIKNIKSEIESMINQFSVTKPHIDPSIFTPNKRYKVKNYDAHGDKNGIFILNKKTEVFVREADNFACTTTLDFSKILEESSDTGAESSQNAMK